MFTSNEEFRLNAEVDRISQELTKAYKDLYDMRTTLIAEKETSRKLEEDRDACIKQLIEERDKAKEEANCAWDELNKAKISALELPTVQELTILHAELNAEKEKSKNLEAEKERAWTKLESTEEALEVLNEKLNKEIIEKETTLVAWERQAEKEKSQILALKKRARKAEKLSKELNEELNFTVSELQKTKASLLATKEPTNLEIAALIYNKQAVTYQEAVAQAIELRKASTNLEQGDVEPKDS